MLLVFIAEYYLIYIFTKITKEYNLLYIYAWHAHKQKKINTGLVNDLEINYFEQCVYKAALNRESSIPTMHYSHNTLITWFIGS